MGDRVNWIERLALAWRRARKGETLDGADEDGIRSCIVCGYQVDVGIGGDFQSKYERMSAHLKKHSWMESNRAVLMHSPATAAIYLVGVVVIVTAAVVAFVLMWQVTHR
jgi:hypothetical protein